MRWEGTINNTAEAISARDINASSTYCPLDGMARSLDWQEYNSSRLERCMNSASGSTKTVYLPPNGDVEKLLVCCVEWFFFRGSKQEREIIGYRRWPQFS